MVGTMKTIMYNQFKTGGGFTSLALDDGSVQSRIMIASPILHVPVTLGTAIFSLGELPLAMGKWWENDAKMMGSL